MKRCMRVFTVIIGAFLSLCAVAFTACGGDEDDKSVTPEKSCLVQVEGGTGGGYYFINTNCTVKAEIPEGKQFIKWISGETDLSPNAEYTFTVTKNVKLKAVFGDDVPSTKTCTLDVHWGNGSGTFLEGSVVTLTVDGKYSGLQFTGWQATYRDADGSDKTEIISTESRYDLTVTKDMYVTACFNESKLATPDNSKGQMFSVSANTAYELDRQKNEDGSRKTALVDGCGYLLYTAYTKNADGGLTQVGQGKIIPLAKQEGEYHSYMYSMDGEIKTGMKGPRGDLYQDTADGKAAIRRILNMEVGTEYFITVQAVAGEDTPYTSSDVSAAYAVTLKN